MDKLMAVTINRVLYLLVLLACYHCQPEENCVEWEARSYRDCTCGFMYLDSERHCQTEYTYLEPIARQRNLQCPFRCFNGERLVRDENGLLHCDCQGTYGTCCERETPFCGDVFLAPSGIIESPEYPNPYVSNDRCAWRISTDPAKRIALSIKRGSSFSVEEGSSINTCDNDWVSVYDGENKNSKLIGPFCGNSTRPFQTIHSSYRHLYIEFISNNNTEYRGFQLEYTTYRAGLRCGPRREYRLPTAIITSPQYPLSYKPQEECEYEIIVGSKNELILTTLEMNLSSSADCLEGDVIEVLRKMNSTSEYETMTRLCGKVNYSPYTIRDSSHVLLKFTSSFTSGYFKLRYEQVPAYIPNY